MFALGSVRPPAPVAMVWCVPAASVLRPALLPRLILRTTHVPGADIEFITKHLECPSCYRIMRYLYTRLFHWRTLSICTN